MQEEVGDDMADEGEGVGGTAAVGGEGRWRRGGEGQGLMSSEGDDEVERSHDGVHPAVV